MMYDDLVKQLRKSCHGCKLWDGYTCCLIGDCTGRVRLQAADAIEELQKAVMRLEEESGILDELPTIYIYPTKWIPVTERLPEDGIEVNIVWCNHNPVIYYQHIKDKPQTATGMYYRGKWYWWSVVVQDYLEEYGEWEPDKMDAEIEVTHWMPLPQPPMEET